MRDVDKGTSSRPSPMVKTSIKSAKTGKGRQAFGGGGGKGNRESTTSRRGEKRNRAKDLSKIEQVPTRLRRFFV